MNRTILIADDSKVMRMIIKKSILMSGIGVKRIHQASSDHEAYTLYKAHPMDLVFVDLNMPEKGGMALIEKIRLEAEEHPATVIVVSSASDQKQIEKIKALGIHFIHKPFTAMQLKTVLDTVMKGGI